MDSDSWLLVVLLFALILGGGYFAAAETAFASSNLIRIRNKAENGDKRAKNALYVMGNFEKALSTLLIGNNIMHIGTASIATYLVTKMWGAGYVAYSTMATTIVVFLVAEMIPKQFAKDNPESLALAFAASLKFLMKILTPVSFLFDSIGKLAVKIFKIDPIPTVTEDELYDIIESATGDGHMDESRGRLINSALEFDDKTVQEILTPRVSIVGIEIDMELEEVLETIRSNKHSRLPVYRETMDDIVGVLNIRRYIKSYLKLGQETRVVDLMDEAYFVPKNKRIDLLFSEISQSRIHMCVVSDDFGGTMGLVTMEDILEELVGEIWDEDDEVREDFRELSDGIYEFSGDMALETALRLIGFDDDDDEISPMTIGAWAQENISDIPKTGSSFEHGKLKVSVLEISDKQHIQRLLIEIANDEDEEEEIDEIGLNLAEAKRGGV